jgi:predicted ArsR family transcriptional regulator
VRLSVIITNEELWKQANELKITEQITRRKWNWIGHTLRKENEIEKEALEWNPQGQRKRGRPKRSWQRTIREEALAAGKTWEEIKQLSKNRVRW